VQRPLVFDNQYDATVRDIDDQYLFGPDLLVAPVTEAGQNARQVYLPAGTWYDWHTSEALAGRQFRRVDTPLDRIPIYARGGAVIPMWTEAPASTAGYHPAVLELHVFIPAADGKHESFLQEDDGLTFSALTGGRYRTTFTLIRAANRVSINATVTGDGYPEFARTGFRVIVHGAQPTVIVVDGGDISSVDGAFPVTNSGGGFELTFAT
jgi:alpha-glucosidase